MKRLMIRLNDCSRYARQLCDDVHVAFPRADKATREVLDAAAERLMASTSLLQHERAALAHGRLALTRSASLTATPLAEGAAALRGFVYHLRSQSAIGAWQGSVRSFCVTSEPPAKGGSRVLGALRTALTGLVVDKSVGEHSAWTRRLTTATTALTAQSAETARLFVATQRDVARVAAARGTWQQAYDHLVTLARGYLLVAGRADEADAIDPFVASQSRSRAASIGHARRARRAASAPPPPAVTTTA